MTTVLNISQLPTLIMSLPPQEESESFNVGASCKNSLARWENPRPLSGDEIYGKLNTEINPKLRILTLHICGMNCTLGCTPLPQRFIP